MKSFSYSDDESDDNEGRRSSTASSVILSRIDTVRTQVEIVLEQAGEDEVSSFPVSPTKSSGSETLVRITPSLKTKQEPPKISSRVSSRNRTKPVEASGNLAGNLVVPRRGESLATGSNDEEQQPRDSYQDIMDDLFQNLSDEPALTSDEDSQKSPNHRHSETPSYDERGFLYNKVDANALGKYGGPRSVPVNQEY